MRAHTANRDTASRTEYRLRCHNCGETHSQMFEHRPPEPVVETCTHCGSLGNHDIVVAPRQ